MYVLYLIVGLLAYAFIGGFTFTLLDLTMDIGDVIDEPLFCFAWPLFIIIILPIAVISHYGSMLAIKIALKFKNRKKD